MTEEASNRHKNDFESLHDMIDGYVQDHGVIPYCIILQLLAMRYLGAGLIDRDFVDKDYPYRSSVSFSCMFLESGKMATFAYVKESSSRTFGEVQESH